MTEDFIFSTMMLNDQMKVHRDRRGALLQFSAETVPVAWKSTLWLKFREVLSRQGKNTLLNLSSFIEHRATFANFFPHPIELIEA